MTELLIIAAGILLTVLFVWLLYQMNYKKEERYRQLLFPVAAVLFGAAVVRLDLLGSLPFIDGFFERFPGLEFYTALLFNLLILLLFLLIKTAMRFMHVLKDKAAAFFKRRFAAVSRRTEELVSKGLRLLPSFWRYRMISGTGKGRTVALFYERGHRDVTLKPEWMYPQILARYGAVLAMALFLLYIFLVPFDWRTAFLDFLPAYPAVALLLFLEVSWFLGGNSPIYREAVIEGEDVKSRMKKNYETLYNDSRSTWEDRVLASGSKELKGLEQMNRSRAFAPLDDEKTLTGKRMALIRGRLQETAGGAEEAYMEMIGAMLEGSSLLVEEPLYGEAKKYMMQGIISTLMNHEKIVFAVKDEAAADKAAGWLREGFLEGEAVDYLWTVELFEKAYRDNTSPHVLVLPVQQLFHRRTTDFLAEKTHGSQYGTFILPETERLLAFHSLDLQRFASVMEDVLDKKPRYWIFSQWYEGIESAVRQTFRVRPKDLYIQSPPSPLLFYFVWKLEGETSFQEALFPALSHRSLSAEAVLGTFAQKYHAGPMAFVHQGSLPTRESFEELIENEQMLAAAGLKGKDIRRMKDHVRLYDPYWTVPKEEHSFLFVRDDRKNLVDTLSYWKGNGSLTSFVQVISPPYLLRDYLADSIDYHMDDPRAVASLPAKQPATPYGRIKPLLDRLLSSEVEEEEVKNMLSRFETSPGGSTISRLHHHLKEAFGRETTIMESLQVRKHRRFNEQIHEFETVLSYRLTEKLARDYPLLRKKMYGLRTQTGEILGFVEESRIYQQYLPGQTHSFHGEQYRIEAVRKAEEMVDISYTGEKKDFEYIHDRHIRLKASGEWTSVGRQTEEHPGVSVTKVIREQPLSIRTDGCLAFKKDAALQEGGAYQPMEDPVERRFDRGKYTEVILSGKSISSKTSFTLAFVLHEMMKTLYPHTHPFLAVTTVLPEDFFKAGDRRELALKRAFPTLEKTGEEEGTVSIFFVEDSPSPMGLAESIHSHLQRIFELLDDYLHWIQENPEQNAGYLRFSFSELSRLFDLVGAAAVAADVTSGGSSLRSRRLAHEPSGSSRVPEDGEGAACHFCTRTFPPTSVEELEDGRIRCRDCAETAVDEGRMVQRIYEQTREFMEEEFGIALRRDLEVKLVSSETLYRESGLFFQPENAVRMTGRASIDEEKNIQVLVENGAPQIATYMTMIHELTHVWQFDELNYAFMTLEELEGFAVWTELYFAEKAGEHLYAENHKNNLRERDDAYWHGYRELEESLKQAPPPVRTPFDLYKNTSGRRAVDF